MRNLLLLSLFATLTGALGTAACSAMSSADGFNDPYGTGTTSTLGTGGEAGTQSITTNVGEGGQQPATVDFSALCGDSCLPVTEGSSPCSIGSGGAGGSGAGGSGAGGTGSGGSGAGGSGAGGTGSGGSSTGGNDVGGGRAVLDGECQLAVSGSGEVSGECGSTGKSEALAPCIGVRNCAAGLGCVADGICLHYCCGSLELCPASTFCDTRAIAKEDAQGVSPAPVIPVCVVVEPCTLLDDATCSTEGQTCTIVRTDGTTSCVDPGAGRAGDGCPCAAGHVCSYAVNQCLKLCRTTVASDCPEGHMCAGGAGNYPEGFGSCVEL